jgi:hypothetical protein
MRELDPGVELVFNEWITEVFTGLPGPSAADVRDRVLVLRAAGVPIDAIGQQAHFVPGIVYAGGIADLSRRTRIDEYAGVLTRQGVRPWWPPWCCGDDRRAWLGPPARGARVARVSQDH